MIRSESQEISSEQQRNRGTRHTSKSKVYAVEASNGKIVLGLGSPYLVLVLAIYFFRALHGQVSLLYKLALGYDPRFQQALQFGSMSSIGGSTVASQLLHLSLKFGFNLGQSGILSFGIFKLGSFLAELSIFSPELALQFGNPFLGGLQLGGVSSRS